jgi:hypothetical protein
MAQIRPICDSGRLRGNTSHPFYCRGDVWGASFSPRTSNRLDLPQGVIGEHTSKPATVGRSEAVRE